MVTYCRVCLKLKSELTSIYTKRKGEYLPRVIYNISGVKIHKSAEPDAKICRRCAAAVVIAQHIILRCQETEQYLDAQKQDEHILIPEVVEPDTEQPFGHVEENQFEEEMLEEEPLAEENAVPSKDYEMYEALQIEIATGETSQNEDEVIIEQNQQQPQPKRKRARQSTASNNIQLFECEHCDYRTKTGRRIIEHRREVHKIYDPNIYACTLCSQRFSWKPTLYRHIQLDHKTLPEDKKFLCNECGRAYTRESHLIEHTKQRHGPRSYKCPDPECEQTFTRAFTLRRHYLASHTDSENVRYHCVECDKYFKIYDLWKYHNEVVHKNETVYCPRCGYAFRFKEKLEEHLEKDVCKKSVIPCTYCQRRFTTKQGLKEHLKAIHRMG